eukprot:3698432-Rhodomonas_salina.1
MIWLEPGRSGTPPMRPTKAGTEGKFSSALLLSMKGKFRLLAVLSSKRSVVVNGFIVRICNAVLEEVDRPRQGASEREDVLNATAPYSMLATCISREKT